MLKWNPQILVLLTGLLLLQGCANAVSYHHAERVSIALEGKSTDPQQPVQGNIGAKVRTVLVTPGTTTSKRNGAGNGEAMSVISDFKMVRATGELGRFGTTSIRSAFITGKAARAAPAASAKALSGAGFGSDPLGALSADREVLLSTIYTTIAERAKTDKAAAEHQARLDRLAVLLPEKSVLDAIAHYPMVDVDPANRKTVTGIELEAQGFARIVEYEQKLREAEAGMKAIQENRDTKLNGNSFTKTHMEALGKALADVQQRRREFALTIGNSEVITVAAGYVINGQ